MIQKLALNGFLGLPSDWNYWSELTPCLIKVAPDLWTWARKFNEWVKKNVEAPRTLIGYSMGGRLALHALLDQPTLYSHGVLISTHPGLKEHEAKTNRIKADQIWAERFRNEPWDELMLAWESQPVFQTAAFRPKRMEHQFARETLANYLENFSLGKQEDLIPQLKSLKVPLTWLTGKKDLICELLAKEVLNEKSTHISLSGGSHRVHFEFPQACSIILEKT